MVVSTFFPFIVYRYVLILLLIKNGQLTICFQIIPKVISISDTMQRYIQVSVISK
jgi:hypothetical protein